MNGIAGRGERGLHSVHKRMVRYWQLYLLALPAVITVFIFHYVPIYGVQIAFRNYRASRGIWGSEWIGLKWFIKFFTYRDFWVIIKNTLSISLYNIAVFPCAVVFALMINEVRNAKYKRYVQMVSYAPHFVSTVVVCAMLILFTRYDGGLFNTVRSLLGAGRMDFMTVPRYFSSLYVWSGVWQNIGWDTIIYLAALSGISAELIEAAQIDGAGRMRIIRHITFPGILPTVITMLILTTGRVLSVGFEKIFLMQNSLNLESSRVISTYVYEMGIVNGQFSYSAAIGLVNNVVNVIFIVLVNQLSKKVTSVGLW